MKTKTQKKTGIGTYKQRLAKAHISIFTSFSEAGNKGLDVKSMRSLRDQLRDINGEYLVEKKRLVKKVVTEVSSHVQDTDDAFTQPGSLGTVFGYGDEVDAARTVYQFAKKHPALRLHGALFGDTVLDAVRLTELAQLPSKDGMRARLVDIMSYPMRGLVTVLSGTVRNLVVVLNQVALTK